MKWLRLMALLVMVVNPAVALGQEARTGGEEDKVAAALLRGQTLAVVRVEVGRVNWDAVEKQAMELAGPLGGGQREGAEQAMRKRLGEVRRVVEAFRKAGGKDVYAVVDLAEGPGAPGFLVATHGANADVNALRSLLYSGRVDGPREEQREGDRADVTAAIEQGVFLGKRSTLERLRNTPAVERKGFAEALAAGGDAPVRGAIVPSEDQRKVAEGLVPALPEQLGGGEMRQVTRGMQWASLSVKTEPEVSAKFVLGAADARSAEALAAIVTRGLGTAVQALPKEAEGVRAALSAMKPAVEGARVTLAFDPKASDAVAGGVIAPMLMAARENARMQQSISQVRQIVLGAHMYAADNNGKWPDTLEQLVERKLIEVNVFQNPRAPQRKPGYVYVKPATSYKEMKEPGRVVIVHEPVDAVTGKVAAGFADGHAEYLAAADLKERLGKQAEK